MSAFRTVSAPVSDLVIGSFTPLKSRSPIASPHQSGMARRVSHLRQTDPSNLPITKSDTGRFAASPPGASPQHLPQRGVGRRFRSERAEQSPAERSVETTNYQI